MGPNEILPMVLRDLADVFTKPSLNHVCKHIALVVDMSGEFSHFHPSDSFSHPTMGKSSSSCAVISCHPGLNQDNLLELVESRTRKIIRGMDQLAYEEMPRELGLFSFKKRRFQGLNERWRDFFFIKACSYRTRGMVLGR